MPRAGQEPPVPEWKSMEEFKGALPKKAQALAHAVAKIPGSTGNECVGEKHDLVLIVCHGTMDHDFQK
jgi:hypothetical protein